MLRCHNKPPPRPSLRRALISNLFGRKPGRLRIPRLWSLDGTRSGTNFAPFLRDQRTVRAKVDGLAIEKDEEVRALCLYRTLIPMGWLPNTMTIIELERQKLHEKIVRLRALREAAEADKALIDGKVRRRRRA